MRCNLVRPESRAASFEASLSLFILDFVVGCGTDKGQDDRQEDEAVGHTEDYDTEEGLEHDDEDVRFGHAERDDSEEGREATVEDTRSHLADSNASLVVALLHGCFT